MQNRSKIISAVLSLSATLIAGQALAAGTVSGVTTDKASITLGQSLNANVQGTINKDVFKKGCQVKITLKYADNSTEIAHPGLLVDAFPATGFYLKPAKSGKVKVIADGGGSNNLGYPACQGSAQSEINVAALIVVNPNLDIKVKPAPGSLTDSAIIIQGTAPPPVAAAPTITGIKQVPYTDQGGETWVEVQGTGVCTYNI